MQYALILLLIWTWCKMVFAQVDGGSNQCPPDSMDCGYFGCFQGACPNDCPTYGDSDSCATAALDDGTEACVWSQNKCQRVSKCVQMVDLTCSSGCRPCGGMGCIPTVQDCPPVCSLYNQSQTCNGSPDTNGIHCVWNDTINTCLYSPLRTDLPQYQSAIAGLLYKAMTNSNITVTANVTGFSNFTHPDNDFLIQIALKPLEPPAKEPDEDGPLSFLSVKGSSRIWPAVIGVIVFILAACGITFLLINRFRAQQNQRHTNVFSHKNNQFLPRVRTALGLEEITAMSLEEEERIENTRKLQFLKPALTKK